MNEPSRRRLAHIVMLALCAGSLVVAPGCRRAPEPPLAGARIGGPLELIDQDGRPVTDRDFAGMWRAVYFGFTYCPDVCPTDLQHLMQGYRQFAKADTAGAAKLRPVFITIDPARDTPTVLKRYVAAFGPGLTGLTGSEAQIAAVAKRYGASYQRVDAKGASEYLMNHSRQTVLFDPAGAPVALLPTDENPAAVAAEFARWVR